jgi:putative endonuclease
VVRCADGTFYTGIAKDVAQRIAAHNSGKGAKYTSTRKPVTLLFQEPEGDYSTALKREYQVKRLKRVEKESFVSGKPLRRPRKKAKMTFMKPRKNKKIRKTGGQRRKA